MEVCTLRDMKPQEKPLISENITKIVKMLLARDDMRLQDLADALNYDAGTITRSISGHREWKVTDLVTMAEFFEVPISLFFEEPSSLVRSRYIRRQLVSA